MGLGLRFALFVLNVIPVFRSRRNEIILVEEEVHWQSSADHLASRITGEEDSTRRTSLPPQPPPSGGRRTESCRGDISLSQTTV